MSILRHLFVAVIYAAAAAAVALALPRAFPAMGIELSLVVGGVVLLGFALLHEAFSRQEEQGRLADELHDLRLAHGEVMRELTRAREEATRIHEALDGFRGGRNSKNMQEDFNKVVAEVRLLQSLVEQLSSQPGHPHSIVPDPQEPPGQPTTGQPTTGQPPPGQLPMGADDAGGAVSGLPPFLIDRGDADSGASRSLAPVARDLDDGAILQIIEDGLRRDRVDLVLQPIVSLPQRKRKFFEAFTRIRADDDSIIVPEQYIAIAEREGLITAIDNMLLFRCVQLLRKTQGKNGNVGFFCNISPYTLADRAFFGEFVEFMSENAELAPNLIFEFAQATIANRDDDIRGQLARLARMGFRFSMDQVASLSLDYSALADQRFKFVKIEAEILLRAFATPSPALDIQVLDLKRSLERHGIDLIVEKIESEPMLLDVLDFQIDFGQGYLFGEPRESETA